MGCRGRGGEGDCRQHRRDDAGAAQRALLAGRRLQAGRREALLRLRVQLVPAAVEPDRVAGGVSGGGSGGGRGRAQRAARVHA